MLDIGDTSNLDMLVLLIMGTYGEDVDMYCLSNTLVKL